ncbi:MAG: PTS sugar transporter subunit IIC, partial [Clostridia bacterium]|nr:PTS sugar transporter subunit IIC [Clostridia bacterium]
MTADIDNTEEIIQMTDEEIDEIEVEDLMDSPEEDCAVNEPTNKQKAISILKKIWNRYFIDAFTGMAQGLFCTLIAGTILAQIASWCGDNSFAKALDSMAKIAKMLMGAGIGVGIANKLGAKPLVIFTAAVTGLIGAFSGGLVDAFVGKADFVFAFGAPG